jgi:hypothetical protein
MNKITISCLILIVSVSALVGTAVAGNVGVSPEAVEEWNNKIAKIDWRKVDVDTFLTKVPTPPIEGDTLTDRLGNKSNCHQDSLLTNNEGRLVTRWTCWSTK